MNRHNALTKYFGSGLKFQLLVLFTVLLAFTIIVVSYSILYNERKILKKTLIANGQEIVKNIAGSVADALTQAPVDDTTLVSVINSTMTGDSKEWVKYIRITIPSDDLKIASNNIKEEW